MSTPIIPPYPAASGPAAALQLQQQSLGYTSAAAKLRREMEEVEDAIVAALDTADRRAQARERARELALRQRQQQRREGGR